jgi:sec-independent protein translocase protein TatA
MGRLGPLEIIIIAAVVLILFGRGKISNLMGEVGKGITAFKRGVKDSSAEATEAAAAAVEAVKDVTPEAEKDKV